MICFPLMESFQDRFIKAVQKRIPDSRCPLCQSSDWEVEPGVFNFRERVRSQYTDITGSALPSAALVCKVCGNVQFVSLAVYGDEFTQDF
jgi:hypothetical protein